MISLKFITLENFRSFKGRHTVSFENGFYCIKGFSGVGKSNILLGISYALGLSPIPATQLKNVFSEEPMQVMLGLEKDDEQIEIIRGAHPAFISSRAGLKLGEWKGASVVNEKVKELFDGQLDSVDLLTIRNQRTNGRFLGLDDSSKKSFLSTILGLTKLEDMIEFQKEKLKEAKAEVDIVNKQIETAKSFMPKQTPDDLVAIQQDILKYKEELRELKEIAEKASLEYNRLESRRQEKISQQFGKLKAFNKSIGVLNLKLATENKVLSIIEDEIKSLNSSRSSYEKSIIRAENELKALLKTLAKNFEELKILSENKCFTCGQKWEESTQEESRLLKANVDIRNQEIELNESIKKLRSDLESAINKLPVLEKNRLFQVDKIEEFKKTIPSYVEEQDDELDWLTSEAKAQDINARKAVLQQSHVSKNIAVLEFKYDRALVDADNAQKTQVKLGELRKSLFFAERQVEEYKISIEINKEFLTKIFEEILYEISNNVNTNLTLIPNVKNISFEFTTVNTTKDGNIKNKIETNIYKNGIKMPGISGGQTSSLELLVDASVHSVISARTGLNLNWLILDEPFEGLHPQDKEACLEILKKLHPNKCVLIVDHSTETKEHFDGFFEVVANEDGLSEIRTHNDAII